MNESSRRLGVGAFVAAITSGMLLLPFAFAPITRDAANAALGGMAIWRGDGPYSATVKSNDVGAALLAAVSFIFNHGRAAEQVASAFAFWHWVTAIFIYFSARRRSDVAGVLAAIIYAGIIGAGGAESVFSPISLVGLPLVLGLEFAQREDRLSRVVFGVALAAAALFAREAVIVIVAYVFDQHRRNRTRDASGKNRYGTFEVVGIAVVIIAACALASAGGWLDDWIRSVSNSGPVRLASSHWWAYTAERFSNFRWTTTPPLVLVSAVVLCAWIKTTTSLERMLVGSVIALWIASWARPAGDISAHLLYAAPGALVVAAAFESVRSLDVFAMRRRSTSIAIMAGILCASPVPFATRAIGFLPPYLAGEDTVSFYGRFFDQDTGYDAALTVDAAYWIEGNTDPDDPILVWGFEPGIYLHSGRKAMCGFTSVIPVLKQREDALSRFNDCLHTVRPKVMAVVRDPRFWTGRRAGVPAYAVSWPMSLRDAVRKDYRKAQKVGGVDLYLRSDLPIKHVGLATVFETNVPK